MTKRRRSKRKPNLYLKPPRTPDMVQERMRQSRAAGKHKSDNRDNKREAIERDIDAGS